MAWKAAPLNSTFLAASIVGILISAFYLPAISLDWAVTFGILFIIMLISAFISMATGAPEPQLGRRKIK